MAKTKKECFIEFVKVLMKEGQYEDWAEKDKWADAIDYFNGLQISGDKSTVKFTENGKLILNYMRENKEAYNNLFKAKDIGEGLSISSRTVSGGMRKLTTDGYVERIGESPVIYSITKLGEEVDFD